MGHQSAFADFVWGHWQSLLMVSNSAWWISEAWIFARDWRRVRGVSHDHFSRATIIAALIVSSIAASWCSAHAVFAKFPDGEIGAVRFASGIALMWLGIGYRQWAVATLGRFFRTTVVVQEGHELVTHGPYRRLRNPSYSGLMVTVLGEGLIMGNWLAFLVMVGGVLAAITWRMAIEARALRTHFGASYDAYAKARWALIPWVW